MLVVSDTSPLFALDHLGLMPVLGAIYGHVCVPPAVVRELARGNRNCHPLDIRRFPFVEVRSPSSIDPSVAAAELDPGETDAISLAREIAPSSILIDELRGRAVARSLGLKIVGVLGVLLAAKSAGHVHEIQPLIDRLINEIGFFVSNQVRRDVLDRAGE